MYLCNQRIASAAYFACFQIEVIFWCIKVISLIPKIYIRDKFKQLLQLIWGVFALNFGNNYWTLKNSYSLFLCFYYIQHIAFDILCSSKCILMHGHATKWLSLVLSQAMAAGRPWLMSSSQHWQCEVYSHNFSNWPWNQFPLIPKL